MTLLIILASAVTYLALGFLTFKEGIKARGRRYHYQSGADGDDIGETLFQRIFWPATWVCRGGRILFQSIDLRSRINRWFKEGQDQSRSKENCC